MQERSCTLPTCLRTQSQDVGLALLYFSLGCVCKKSYLHASCHILAAIPAQGPSCCSTSILGPPWAPKMSSCLDRGVSYMHDRWRHQEVGW